MAMSQIIRVGTLVLTALYLVQGTDSHVFLPVPTNAREALLLYEHGSRSGNPYHTQVALAWMEDNFETVLSSWYLQFLDDVLLNKLLARRWFIDEIHIFRAIQRLVGPIPYGDATLPSSVEAAINISVVSIGSPNAENVTNQNSTLWKRHDRNLLLSNLYLGSLTPEQIQDEVIPSGLLSCSETAEILVRRLENNSLWEFQRTDPTVGRVLPKENLLRSDLRARILENSYTLSKDCFGQNPLLPATNPESSSSQNACYLSLNTPGNLTFEMHPRSLINRAYMQLDSARRCTLRVLSSMDGFNWKTLESRSNAYSGESFTFSTHFTRYVKLDVSSCHFSSNSSQTDFSINMLWASYVP